MEQIIHFQSKCIVFLYFWTFFLLHCCKKAYLFWLLGRIYALQKFAKSLFSEEVLLVFSL